MRRLFSQGDESDYEFHVEDEGKFWELVREFENSEEIRETTQKAVKQNSCEICKKKFRSKYHLKLHMPVHTGEKNYKCGICRKSYQQKWNLITHMDRVHAKEKPFKCTECSRSFGYSSHFKRHLKMHFVEKMQAPEEIKRKILNPFSCKDCPRSFDSNYRLRMHTEKHGVNGLLRCDKCGLIFKTKTMINNHLLQHENEDSKLDIISQALEDSSLTFTPTKKVHKPPQFTKLEVANNKSDKPSQHQGKAKIPCDICGKTMMKESMKRHLNIHFRSTVYKCQYCSKEFLERSQKTAHERKHTGEKPYFCAFCGKWHSQYDNLLTHLLTYHNTANNSTSDAYNANENVITLNASSENLEIMPGTDYGVDTVVTWTIVSDKPEELEHGNTYIIQAVEDLIVTTNIMEDVTNDKDNFNAEKSYFITDVKKRMNNNIFEKIVEDLYNSNIMSTEVKLAVENIRKSVGLVEIDPLKELLKIIKPIPINTVARQIDGKLRWVCWICNSVFVNRYILSRHLIKHEPKEERPYKCDECKKKFTQSSSYKEHLMFHSNKNQFYCEKCGCGFRYKTHLNNHLKKHGEKIYPDKPKKFQCLHCDKKFYTNSHKEEHMRSHTKEKPFMCKVCGAQFSALSTLNRHSGIHMSAQYKCEICFKLFKQRSSLKRHENIHAGDASKKVACKCGKLFSQRSSLNKHKMICKSHGEPPVKPYNCSLCFKRFLTKSDLKRHSGTHETIKKYKCEICFVSLKTRETYSRHIRRHNKNAVGQSQTN